MALSPRHLLLTPALTPGQVASLLGRYGFKDIPKAHANLAAMAEALQDRELLAVTLEELLGFLGESADPDQALNLLERFAEAYVHRVRPFPHLKGSRRSLRLLAEIFGASPFMAEILIRHPAYLDWIAGHEVLATRPTKKALLRDLSTLLGTAASDEEKIDLLPGFKGKEILHVGVRDLLRIATVKETLGALSTLAEVLIQKAYEICESSLRRRYRREGGRGSTRRERAGFTVLALGKLGGGELNFSSDVDLVYLYASDEEPAALRRALAVPLPEFFRRLGKTLTAALSEATGAGCVYRVDLRLRPEGRMGALVHSLDAFERYYASRGATWERLALLKAWPVAGDRSLGVRFLKRVRPFIYATPFEGKALTEVRGIKSRIDERVRIRGQSHLDVKLGFGGIREIELVVQTLQVAFGGRLTGIRQRNTLKALRALARHGLLPREEERALAAAYLFLRDVENKLQMVHAFQTHSLPSEAGEIRLCARRLGYRDGEGGAAQNQLLSDYRRHTGEVNRVFRALFDSPWRARPLRSGP